MMQITAVNPEAISTSNYRPTEIPNVYLNPEAASLIVIDETGDTAIELTRLSKKMRKN